MKFSTLTYSIKPALWWFQDQNWTNLFPSSASDWSCQLKRKYIFFVDKIKIIARKLWFWCTCYINVVRRVSVLEKCEGKFVKSTCKNKPQKKISDKCVVTQYEMVKWFSHMMYLIMEFHIHSLILIVYSLKCMGAVTIHVTMSIWNASVGKQKHDLMCGFRSQGKEVPEHVTILQYKFKCKSQNLSQSCNTDSSISPKTCHNLAI